MAIRLMVIEPKTENEPYILEARINGKLSEQDYEELVPQIEVLIFKHKLRLLFELIDFYGYEAGVFWEDTRFASRLFPNIERVAIIGEKHWARGIMHFCRPFEDASIRYYDSAVPHNGRGWIRENQ